MHVCVYIYIYITFMETFKDIYFKSFTPNVGIHSLFIIHIIYLSDILLHIYRF